VPRVPSPGGIMLPGRIRYRASVGQRPPEPEMLLGAAQKPPAGFLEDRVAALASHAAGFLGTNLVERLVHIGDDVEPVEDMQSFGTFFADELQVGFPHVGADEADLGSDLLPMALKNSWKDSMARSFPSQSGRVRPTSIW